MFTKSCSYASWININAVNGFIRQISCSLAGVGALGGLEFACLELTCILYWSFPSLAALRKLWLTAQKRVSKSPKKRSVSRSPSGSRSRSKSLSRSHSSLPCFSFFLCPQVLRLWLCIFLFELLCVWYKLWFDSWMQIVCTGEVWLFHWMPRTMAKFHVALSIVCFANLEFLIDADLCY